MITVTVPIYFNQTRKKTILLGLNWYRNAHFLILNKAKTHIASIVKSDIIGEPILNGTIHVHFRIYLRRKGTDGGNIRAVIEKFVLDGIKKAGYISEDNADIIVSDSSEYLFDKENPRAEITLTTQ